MNPLMKPAFISLSESAKQVTSEFAEKMRHKDHIHGSVEQRAEAFLQGKPIPKPLPGSLLAGMEKRLGLMELGGEVARLELLLNELKSSQKYSPAELRVLTSKIEFLKSEVRHRMSA